MELRYIDASRKNEWEDLVKSNPTSGYMQSFFWAEFLNLIGWQIYKIGIFENNKLIGGAIVAKYLHFKNKNFLSISEGPVLPYNNKNVENMFHLLISEIDKIADLKGNKLTSHLSIQPKLEYLPKFFSRFKKSPTDQQPMRTLIIDLSLTEQKILKQMKPKGRYNIKVAQKHNVEISQINLQGGLKDFLNLYQKFVKKRGFKGKDNSYFESLTYVLPDSDQAEFYFANKDGQILSVALVVYYGKTATFLYGATSEKEKSSMAAYLLHWEIIKRAKKKGLKWYDFYSLAPGDNITSHPWYGYTVFKRKFGGQEVNLIGAYNFIYNEKLYKEFLVESEKE